MATSSQSETADIQHFAATSAAAGSLRPFNNYHHHHLAEAQHHSADHHLVAFDPSSAARNDCKGPLTSASTTYQQQHVHHPAGQQSSFYHYASSPSSSALFLGVESNNSMNPVSSMIADNLEEDVELATTSCTYRSSPTEQYYYGRPFSVFLFVKETFCAHCIVGSPCTLCSFNSYNH